MKVVSIYFTFNSRELQSYITKFVFTMLSVTELKDKYQHEQILIVVLARLYFSNESPSFIQDFIDTHDINWERFYALLSINHIRGFAYNIISSSSITIDPVIHKRLEKKAMEIAVNGFYQLRLTRHLLEEFKELHIQAIPYKGATLAARYYGSPFLRESSDVDFLVAESSVRSLRNYFHGKNYLKKFDVSDEYLPFIIRYYKELSFKAPQNTSGLSCSVEIQWRLLEHYFGRFPNYDFFVPHLQTYTDKNGNLQTCLSPTYDFFCCASHHLIKEPLWRLKYLIDLGCIIQLKKDEIDWPFIIRIFKKLNYHNFLNSGMTALDEIVGVSVPEHSFKKFSYSLFIASEQNAGVHKSYIQRFKAVNSKQGFFKKIQFSILAWLSLLTPNLKDLEAFKLPPFAIPLLLISKPFRILFGNKKKLPG